jgi:hypothetical protein
VEENFFVKAITYRNMTGDNNGGDIQRRILPDSVLGTPVSSVGMLESTVSL